MALREHDQIEYQMIGGNIFFSSFCAVSKLCRQLRIPQRFGNSSALASAYGVAVTTTMIIT